MTSLASARSATDTLSSSVTTRGGNLLISEKTWLKKIFGTTGTHASKMLLIEGATRRQLGAILLIAFNLCTNKQSSLPKAHRILLLKYDRELQQAFFHLKSVNHLRKILLTAGLIPALIVTLRTKGSESLVAQAIRNILFGQ